MTVEHVRDVTTRTCAMTRARAPKEALLRLTLDGEGAPFVDLLGRAPGRGTYVRADREVLKQALSKKGLGRLFRGKARPMSDAEIEGEVARTRERLEKRLLELVGLARRAGVLRLGADETERALAANGVALVLLALDASERTVRKMDRGNVVVVRTLTKQGIGRILGRDEVSVVAFQPSKLADRIAAESARLAGFSGRVEREAVN